MEDFRRKNRSNFGLNLNFDLQFSPSAKYTPTGAGNELGWSRGSRFREVHHFLSKSVGKQAFFWKAPHINFRGTWKTKILRPVLPSYLSCSSLRKTYFKFIFFFMRSLQLKIKSNFSRISSQTYYLGARINGETTRISYATITIAQHPEFPE